MESDRDRGCRESNDHKNVSLRKFLRLGRCPECRLWGQTEKHSARADVFCSSSKTDVPTTLRLWNVDRSNVCFCQISCLAIAISIRPKSAKGGSVGCFDPNRSRAPTGYRTAASVCCTSKNRLGTETGPKLQDNQELVTPWPRERITLTAVSW